METMKDSAKRFVMETQKKGGEGTTEVVDGSSLWGNCSSHNFLMKIIFDLPLHCHEADGLFAQHTWFFRLL